MRRLLLLLLPVLLLLSCATTGEDPVDETVIVDEEVVTIEPVVVEPDDAEVAEQVDAVEEVDEEPVAVAVEVVPSPQTLVLSLPGDLSRLNAVNFVLAASLDSEDGESPESLEVEVISGPIVAGEFGLTDLSALPSDQRTFAVKLADLSAGVLLGSLGEDTQPPTDPVALQAAAAISLPPGIVDGEVYIWRARGVLSDGDYTMWTEPVETRMDFGFAVPVGEPQPATIDSTPVLTWQKSEEFVAYRVTLQDSSGGALGQSVTRDVSYVVPEPLPSGRYRFTVSGLRTDGYATRAGEATLVRVLADANPVPAWPRRGEETLGDTVGLHWTQVSGATEYRARYRSADGEWLGLPPTSRTFIPIPERLQRGDEYEWQVQAADENGKLFSWSSVESFSVGASEIGFVTVIPNGESGQLTRGYDGGSRDESPAGQVLLTVPFEMARTPLTNSEVSRVVNYALARGFVVATDSGVYLDETPLIGLGEMDYGHQIGLTLEDGLISAREGHGDHPAVGITWAGAVALANLLSFVEGRVPAYDMADWSWNHDSDGYRLPTEAEWEYAARGSTTRLFPSGSPLTGRAANYYRSFDPYEDVNEPFDTAGGPTTPVGFFNGSVWRGFQTTDGSSPFGILDMVGNSWDWCWDRYDPDYYSSSESTDPFGPEESDLQVTNQAIVIAVALDPDQRVVRGTAWNSRAPDVRLTNRGRYTELGRSYSIGIRLVRSPQ